MKKKLMMLILCMMVGLAACGKAENENPANGAEDSKTSETVQENATGVSYEGEYASYDIDEPMLLISKNENGTYAIQVGVYRLVQLDNCVGVENGNQLDFSTTEWGEDQEITGTLTLDGDIATVTFYAPWSDTWFKDVNEYQYYRMSDKPSQSKENENAGGTTDIVVFEEKCIQDEIAGIEEKSRAHLDIDSSNMGQQDMNRHSAEWYKIWDDELNSLWSRLSDELDADTKEKVLEEQRAWIKRKEENMKAAGMQALGGSLQPLLESDTAGEMTRARVYVLAGYLAEVRNETFTILPEIQESIDAADPSLFDVFEKFEGQWMFDGSRGACVGVEPTAVCGYGEEGSTWTVWVTGGDIITDLDVYGYTANNIIFKVEHEDHDAYYELSFNMAGSINFAYGQSLDAMDDVIVCD